MSCAQFPSISFRRCRRHFRNAPPDLCAASLRVFRVVFQTALYSKSILLFMFKLVRCAGHIIYGPWALFVGMGHKQNLLWAINEGG